MQEKLDEITLTKLDERCDVDAEGIVAVSPSASLLAIHLNDRLTIMVPRKDAPLL